jgi:hypothetical protein
MLFVDSCTKNYGTYRRQPMLLQLHQGGKNLTSKTIILSKIDHLACVFRLQPF